MDFLANYGIFLAKTTTIVLAILIVLIAILAMTVKAKAKQKGMLIVKKLNNQYDKYKELINEHALPKEEQKALKKNAKKHNKAKKTKTKHKARIFVLNFYGDIKASRVSALREEITAVLLTVKPRDEVLIRLESPGGLVNAYGLAASQLQRLREAKVNLTIVVDKVAASGGYMMACVANQIVAAPFAVIGSIGVLAQLPNFHRYLQKKNIDFEQLSAGEYKRTLTLFGENDKAGRAKLQQEIDETHELFKSFISQHRTQVDIDKVATGEHWYATRAFELNLIDKLQTSDDYLLAAKDHFDIYEVKYQIKKTAAQKMLGSTQQALARLLTKGHSGGQDYLPM